MAFQHLALWEVPPGPISARYPRLVLPRRVSLTQDLRAENRIFALASF